MPIIKMQCQISFPVRMINQVARGESNEDSGQRFLL